MKRLLVSILFSVVFLLLPSLASADADQACYGNPFTDGKPVAIKYTLHGQVFRPTMNHLNKVAIFAGSNDSSAKVKLKIQKAWWGWQSPSYEKTIVLNNAAWWAEANFGEIPVTPGADYFLTVEPLNNSSITWYISQSSTCNPNGYAFVGGDINYDKDFYFMTRGTNSTVQLEYPVEQTPQQSSATVSEANSSTSNNTSASQQPSSVSGKTSAQSSSTNNLVSDQELQSSNKSVANSETISKEEMEELLEMISDDYSKRKKGMFGLSGVIGSFLTPTVFYSIIAIVLILITLLIVRSVKNRKKLSS